MPIYYVVTEYTFHEGRYSIHRILKVISTTTGDMEYNRVWQTEVQPLLNTGEYRNIQVLMLYREPDNPFKNFER